MTNVQGKYEIKNIFFLSKSKNFFHLTKQSSFCQGQYDWTYFVFKNLDFIISDTLLWRTSFNFNLFYKDGFWLS